MTSHDYIGKTCPYCLTPFDPYDDVIVCDACDMPHHAECWYENGKCTTYGCTGSPIGEPVPPRGYSRDQFGRYDDFWGSDRHSHRVEAVGCCTLLERVLYLLWDLAVILFWIFIIFTCLLPSFCGG